jgi:ketosteroid isomerase-like protein
VRGEDAFHAYCRAFEAKNAEAILALFDKKGLYELPLLGQRLMGEGEIRAGLARIFSIAESCSIEVSRVKSLPPMTIAEGRLRAKLHREAEPMELPCAIVLATSAGKIARLSKYLDARPHRLWSDGPIFAPAGRPGG